MAFSTSVKQWINLPLAILNLRVETLAATKAEKKRVRRLIEGGHFQEPAFPLLESFSTFDAKIMADGYAASRDDCRRLVAGGAGENGYDPTNEYFHPADACPTYVVARVFKPRLWLEVGSGNSTKVVRHAIDDGRLPTKLICVDPLPRTDIATVADQFINEEAQRLKPSDVVDRLNGNDVLFIDSSHAARTGSDVCHLLLNIVPRLRPGVLVHVHDVFLPYDYPQHWIEEGRDWTEQYLVQAILQFGTSFKVIWPGCYVQRCRPDLRDKFDFLDHGMAASLWLRWLGNQGAL